MPVSDPAFQKLQYQKLFKYYSSDTISESFKQPFGICINRNFKHPKNQSTSNQPLNRHEICRYLTALQ